LSSSPNLPSGQLNDGKEEEKKKKPFKTLCANFITSSSFSYGEGRKREDVVLRREKGKNIILYRPSKKYWRRDRKKKRKSTEGGKVCIFS